jgi:hypothetical protein
MLLSRDEWTLSGAARSRENRGGAAGVADVSTTLRLCRDLQAGTIPPIFYVDKLQENVGTLSSQSHQK